MHGDAQMAADRGAPQQGSRADTSDVELALRWLWLMRDEKVERFGLSASLSSASSYRAELIQSARKPEASSHPARAFIFLGLVAGPVLGLGAVTWRQALRRP